MSTKQDSSLLESALASVPKVFRTRLIKRYTELKSAFLEAQHDACGLRAGKFCEVLLRYLQSHLTGTSTKFGTKLGNFRDECVKLEQAPKTAGSEGFRIVIPRALNLLYTLRNKRGIGHEGGDLDANKIDAATCVRVADWCMCELIRDLHNLPIEAAQDLLDTIACRQIPEVWEGFGGKRVLSTKLTKKHETLLLLYSDPSASVLTEDLYKWVEYSGLANYKRDVLRKLHKARMVEYVENEEYVLILPPGVAEVEGLVLPKLRGTAEARCDTSTLRTR